jgi:hypothetical protein
MTREEILKQIEEKYSKLGVPVDAMLEPTATPTTASTVPPSLPSLKNNDPQLYCAFEFSY